MSYDFDSILLRLKGALSGTVSAMEGTFTGDILQAVAAELARIWSQEMDSVTQRACYARRRDSGWTLPAAITASPEKRARPMSSCGSGHWSASVSGAAAVMLPTTLPGHRRWKGWLRLPLSR